MLRESSVTYASVPQEEGTTPSSHFVTTRPSQARHSRRDCRITAIITSITIIVGIVLAILLPLALNNVKPAEGSGRGDELEQPADGGVLWSSHLNADGGSQIETGVDGDSGEDRDSESVPLDDHPDENAGEDANIKEENKATTPKAQSGEEVIASTTEAPLPKVTTVSSDEGVLPEKEDTPKEEAGLPVGGTFVETQAGAANTTGDLGNVASKANVTSEGEESAGGGPSVEESLSETKASTESPKPVVADDTVKTPPTEAAPVITAKPAEHEEVDDEAILNELYGNLDSPTKPGTQALNTWMNQVINDHDEVTLILLAVVVAVAVAAVIVAMAWFIHNRVSARRRRINIQNVITDLQSRDKVVLLNSEESEEE